MNVKLKKFEILEPKVKITTGLKTIAREPHSGDKAASNASVFGSLAGRSIFTAAVLLPWLYQQETNNNVKTSATLTIKPATNCLLVVAAMSRSEAMVNGDGWQTVTSEIAGSQRDSQRITVWYKKVPAGTYTITVTQADNVRMSLKLMCIYNADRLTVVDNILAASVPINPTATTTKRRLYLLSSIYASTSSNPPNSITVNNNGVDLEAAEETRFSAFYDDKPEAGVSPTFSYFDENSYSANTINMISFNIEEV